MRQFFGLLFSFFISLPLFAQNCANAYYYLKAGTKSEMSVYNDKDKLVSINRQEIVSIQNTSTGFEANVNSSMQNDKRKVLTENIQF